MTFLDLGELRVASRSPPSPKQWVISHDSKRQVLREEILALPRPRSEEVKCLVENIPLLSFVTYPSSHITNSHQRYRMNALEPSLPDLKNVNDFKGHYLTLLGAEGWTKSTHLQYMNYDAQILNFNLNKAITKVSNNALMRHLKRSRCRQMALTYKVPCKVFSVLVVFDPKWLPARLAHPTRHVYQVAPIHHQWHWENWCQSDAEPGDATKGIPLGGRSVQFLLREEILNSRVTLHFTSHFSLEKFSAERRLPSQSSPLLQKGSDYTWLRSVFK